MDAKEKESLYHYLFLLRRRNPDIRPHVHRQADNLIDEIPRAWEACTGRPCTPDEIKKVKHKDFREKARKNAFSDFISYVTKADPDILKELLVITTVIQRENKNFIIGSPIVNLSKWVPLHCKVAIKLVRSLGFDSLHTLKDISEIRQINEEIAKRSTLFAGPSQKLIKSLADHCRSEHHYVCTGRQLLWR